MSLINTQYDSIMRMYAPQAGTARQELEERLGRIHREIPELFPWKRSHHGLPGPEGAGCRIRDTMQREALEKQAEAELSD
ncbi:MAG: hypothetical protein V8Q27_00475 [Eubacteriales bacterium]